MRSENAILQRSILHPELGLDQNPLHALSRPEQAAQKSQEISLWVAMDLRDPCNTVAVLSTTTLVRRPAEVTS